MKIKDYLTWKKIAFKENKGEIITKCLFGGCDDENHTGFGHLYFNAETSQYDCKKCGEKGNLATLRNFLGDKPKEKKSIKVNKELIEKLHSELPASIREYLNDRGITNVLIDERELGYGSFYGKNYITIPIGNGEHGYYLKLRQDPTDGNEKTTHPNGEATLYGVMKPGENLVICEGELDALALISLGINAVTSTHGAQTFKTEWIEAVKEAKAVYVCYDIDTAGKTGAEKVLKMLDQANVDNIFNITLPDEVGEKGDITDYLTKLKLPMEELFSKYSMPYPEPIDPSQFSPMSGADMAKVLDLTIKKDDDNKIIALLCCASAYTEDSQTNLSFNSPSSTGKSYTALEVAKLFPSEDVIKLGNCSKTAFFHEQGVFDKEKNQINIDLSRKIIIFTDMPHTGLLESLRSFLSHDEKIMLSKITDKNQQGGNRTKTVALKGFPSFIFCSAGLKMDVQEMTRFILLNPETNQEKIRAGISNTILKEADGESFVDTLESDPDRKLLKIRIEAIKRAKIKDIHLKDPNAIEKRYLELSPILQPRHQRDVKKLISLIKSFALMNLWWRNPVGRTITATEDDENEAFALWSRISAPQELNIPPYVYDVFTKVIKVAFEEKNAGVEADKDKVGVSRDEIIKKHYGVLKNHMGMDTLRHNIIPMLESSGLITREKDKEDGRRELVSVNQFKTELKPENNNVKDGGVTVEDVKLLVEEVG